tara:strand:+ start:4826 stop:6496 length:1671 start_codon:yes stop_codon:yes gene_type:complete
LKLLKKQWRNLLKSRKQILLKCSQIFSFCRTKTVIHKILSVLFLTLSIYSCVAQPNNNNTIKQWFEGGEIKRKPIPEKLKRGSRDSTQAFEGKFSILLDKQSKIGFYTVDSSVLPNDIYEIQVWKLSEFKSPLIEAKGENNSLTSFQEKSDSSIGEWQLLKKTVHIPPNFKGNSISFYVKNPKGKKVYFDNFEIKKANRKVFPNYEDPALQIKLSDSCVNIFKKRRLKAFQDGYLSSEDRKWVEGKVKIENKWVKAKIKLKGDRLLHLKGSKWSLKIKLKKPWKGMHVFSIHKPAARDFLKEWRFHELLLQNNLATTQYGFTPVVLNGKSLGYFAWQEHLSNMTDSNSVILGFDDELFWVNRALEKKLDVIKDASIKVYRKSNKFDSLPITLLQDYQNNTPNVELAFDIEKIASYFALVDVSNAYHGDYWINQKFLFNLKTKRLEIIGHDAYTVSKNFVWPNLDYWGSRKHQVPPEVATSKRAILTLFENEKFYTIYKEKLIQYSSKKFIDSFQESIQTEEKIYYNNLLTEYPFFDRNSEFLNNRSQKIRQIISKE